MLVEIRFPALILMRLTIDGTNYPIKSGYATGYTIWLFKGNLYVATREHHKHSVYQILGNYTKLPKISGFNLLKQPKRLICYSESSLLRDWWLDKGCVISLTSKFWYNIWTCDDIPVMEQRLNLNPLKWLRFVASQTRINAEECIVPHLIGILISSSLDG
jgi:hypothetical protein